MSRPQPAPKKKPGCLRLIAGTFALLVLIVLLFSACSAMFASDPAPPPPSETVPSAPPIETIDPDAAPDYTATFYASPQGERWAADAVTVQRIDSGLTVWVVTGNLDTVEDALQLCNDVQNVLAEPDHQINVGVLGDRMYVSTTGDPETCTVE